MTTPGASGRLPFMPNDNPAAYTPQASVATMAPNPNPPPLAVAGNGNGATVQQPHPADGVVEGAPKRRQRRQAAPQAAPQVVVVPPASGAFAPTTTSAPLDDAELQDLGALQVLAARAGVSVEDYVEDARRLCRSYDRFQAYVAARKAATGG